MARVVPSQVVSTIDRLFTWAATQHEGETRELSCGHSPQIAAILELIDRIPDELITLEPGDFSTLRVCVSVLKEHVEQWRSRPDVFLVKIHGLPDLSPISLIRRCLAGCADEAPATDTPEILFVQDAELRNSIRLDISGAERDLRQGEWKGATVLAG